MIQQLWRDNPRANIGVPCGARFWVLDVDPRHGGLEALQALEGNHGELPDTLRARTPSGGVHYFFAPDDRARNSASKVGPGLDIRGHGGYVCVEGSTVAGSGYAFQDWDPLMDAAPELPVAPKWLLERAFGSAKATPTSAPAGGVVEGKRNDFLSREAGKLRRTGQSPSVIEAALQQLNAERCIPPLESSEVAAIAKSIGRYEPPAGPAGPQRHIMNWRELAKRQPPQFSWLLDHWLSWHPTLLSGRGGIGKSLLAQQIATGLATGRPLWGTSCAPVKVLYWACEDDEDELWRRQDRICRSLNLGFDSIDNLVIDARCGLDNAIFATDFGKPAWTPLYGELQAQVNDYEVSVLILDNISQTYGGNENDRHHVTTFLNGIVGLVRGRPFCPIILGHIAKSPSSEYSGSTAWENAARMRWYLAEKLPDETDADPIDSGTETSDTRFLCKRKTNYSANDYVRLKFDQGVFAPGEDTADGGVMPALRARRHMTIVLEAVKKLAAMGIYCTQGKGVGYLPSKIAEMKLGEGLSKAELRTAMNALLVDGKLTSSQVGIYSNRTPKMGLVATP